MERLTTRLSTVREFGGVDGEVSESGPRKKRICSLLRPRLFSPLPTPIRKSASRHPQPTATFPGAQALRLIVGSINSPGQLQPRVGRALEIFQALRRASAPKAPGPCKAFPTHPPPTLVVFPPTLGDSAGEAVGSPRA